MKTATQGLTRMTPKHEDIKVRNCEIFERSKDPGCRPESAPTEILFFRATVLS